MSVLLGNVNVWRLSMHC